MERMTPAQFSIYQHIDNAIDEGRIKVPAQFSYRTLMDHWRNIGQYMSIDGVEIDPNDFEIAILNIIYDYRMDR